MDRRNIDLDDRSMDLGEVDVDSLPKHHPDLPEEPKGPSLLKRLAGFFIVILLLVGVGFAGLYWYVRQAPLKQEPGGRTNILVVGVDDTANLADTIMVASIDLDAKPHPSVAVVSVPRDLYVDIPGFETAKINSAYSYGQNYADSGVDLTVKTVEENFGLPIHYYAVINFSGFVEAVDAVGGVSVNVEEAVDDPYYPDNFGGYDGFYLPAGVQTLDGETALKFARSRQTTSDFDRAARQQQIVLALREKVMSTNTLLNRDLIGKLSGIADKHIQTNLSIREATKLADVTRSVPMDSMKQYVLSNRPDSYLVATSDYGGYGLVPKDGDFSAIRSFLANIFTAPSAPAPEETEY